MPMPTKRTPAVVEEILAKLSQGETLAAICRENEKFPHPNNWLEWCAADEALSLAYARARDAGEAAIAEYCLEIADDARNDFMEKEREDGSTYEAYNAEHVQRSKLRIETRLKLLAIWNPKKYGAKVDVTTDNKPITASTDDIAARTAALLAAAKARKDGGE